MNKKTIWKKLIILTVILAAAVTCLFACKSDEEETPTASATPTYAPSGPTLAPDITIDYDATQFVVSGTTVVEYIGEGGEVTIPNDITVIGPSAFAGAAEVTKVNFPKTVVEIGSYAFENCTGLTGELVPPVYLKYLDSYAFKGCTGITSVTLPEDKLYGIGTNVFEGCTALETAVFPGGLISTEISTTVPAYTFKGCTSLKEVSVFPKAILIGEGAFEGCSSLEKFEMPEKVKTVEDRAFAGCTKLADITMNKVLIYVGAGALKDTVWFSNAVDAVKNVQTDEERYIMVGQSAIIAYVPEKATGNIDLIVPDKAYSICEGAFDGFKDRITSVTIGANANIENLGKNIFNGCTKLTKFELPSKIKEINEGLFENCTSLETIDIKSSLTSVGARAFFGCTNLKEIYLPNSITFIGNEAFYNCSSLTEVVFPTSIVTIGDYAFKDCTSIENFTFTLKLSDVGVQAFDNTAWYDKLSVYDETPTENQFHVFGNGVLIKADIFEETIVIPDNVKSIAAFTFNGWKEIGDREFYGSPLPKSVTIPEGVTRIGDYAFYFCENLETVFISDTVTSIGKNAFYGCSVLREIVIPDSVSEISDYAFYGCYKLEKVTLPANCTKIGRYAFYNCFSLEELDIPETVTDIGAFAFTGTPWFSYESEPYFVINGMLIKCNETDSDIVIPEEVTKIVGGAFENETSVNVTVPAGVTTVSEYAFSGCIKLENVTFLGTVTSIETRAFNGCKALKMAVPEGAEIADDAFANSGLEK